MYIGISILALVVSSVFLFLLLRRTDKSSVSSAEVSERVWDELKSSIPEADYNYLRATAQYMSGNPGDLVSRLNHIGAVHEPKDPQLVRIAILELRMSDIQLEIDRTKNVMPSETHIAWVAVAAVSTVSSLIALVFYLLQAGFLPT